MFKGIVNYLQKKLITSDRFNCVIQKKVQSEVRMNWSVKVKLICDRVVNTM